MIPFNIAIVIGFCFWIFDTDTDSDIDLYSHSCTFPRRMLDMAHRL
jgi:hypothetical protein